ncbi:MAG TPA: DMT family transporter, partial [Alphaproteobacteria bacterium]|nr:DMT family transporter [Alphaproteobacteria bacterium]
MSDLLKAALLATLATLFFSCMSILIRHVSAELHALEIVFFRNLLALAWMTPWLIKVGPAGLRTKRIGMFSFRACISVVGMTSGFWAITLIPIAEATALSFLAPIFATVGAALFLGEDVRLRRWAAVIIGFVGAMVVLRPGEEMIQFGALLALVNAVAMAGNKLVLKSLTRTEKPEAIVTYMVLLLTPMTFIPALFVWQWPTWEALAWMVLLAGCGTVGHMCITKATGYADLTVVMPFDFTRLPLSAVLAFLLFAEVPTVWTWIGGAVIFASTFYIARREAQ